MKALKDWTKRRARWQKIFLMIFIIIIVIMGIYGIEQIKYYPWKNSNPKYFVTIKGHVDPAIKNIVKFKWIAVYGSSIEACDREAGPYPFREYVGPRDMRIAYVPTIDASGNYEVHIPIDYFRPGYCHWQIYRVEDAGDVYQLRADDRAEIDLLFYPCGHTFGCEYSDMYPKTERDKQYKTSGTANDIYQFDQAGRLEFTNVIGDGKLNLHNQIDAVPRDNNYLLIENHVLKP